MRSTALSQTSLLCLRSMVVVRESRRLSLRLDLTSNHRSSSSPDFSTEEPGAEQKNLRLRSPVWLQTSPAINRDIARYVWLDSRDLVSESSSAPSSTQRLPKVEERIEVTATRLPEEPEKVPAPIEVFTGDELRARGATDFRSAMASAAALVTRPRLVLLDEPTSQLDPVAGDELIWLLRRLNEEWGVAMVPLRTA